MNPICVKCKDPFFDSGALLFSPPEVTWDGASTVKKLHLCKDHWTELLDWLYPKSYLHIDTPKEYPPAHGGCHCMCHNSDVVHVAPCCYPQDDLPTGEFL